MRSSGRSGKENVQERNLKAGAVSGGLKRIAVRRGKVGAALVRRTPASAGTMSSTLRKIGAQVLERKRQRSVRPNPRDSLIRSRGPNLTQSLRKTLDKLI